MHIVADDDDDGYGDYGDNDVDVAVILLLTRYSTKYMEKKS